MARIGCGSLPHRAFACRRARSPMPHPEAGWRSAVIYSMIGSCRRRGLNPQEHLTDVLGRLPGLTPHQLEPLLPGKKLS
jgi:hypothetical protein